MKRNCECHFDHAGLIAIGAYHPFLQRSGITDMASYAFDLYAAIPYHSLSLERRRKLWDDGVHLRPDGYDWMGEHIANAFIKLMIQDVGATDRKSRRMLRYAQDELLFPEEAGDPNRIDEGYVIVRLKDLD